MNVKVAFNKLDGVTEEQMRPSKIKPGYNFFGTHMIFEINMDGKFTCKARLVSDGRQTDAPASIMYLSVFSRDIVGIGMTVVSLNGLDIFAYDIGNVYLNATFRGKLWTLSGVDFVSDKGRAMIIARSLYGMKSSGAAWISKLLETLRDIG